MGCGRLLSTLFLAYTKSFFQDPEFNVLGQKGIRSRASLKAATGMPESPQKVNIILQALSLVNINQY